MAKRQALGIISNINTNANGISSSFKNNQMKTSASSTSLKSSSAKLPHGFGTNPNLNQLMFNDENEPVQCLLATKSLKSSAASNECDFEIFQEDLSNENRSNKNFNNNKLKNNKNSSSNLISNKENDTNFSYKNKPVLNEENEKIAELDNDKDEEYDREDVDHDDYYYEDEDEEEEDDDEYDSENNDKDLEEEEEGISRLNLVALIENSNENSVTKENDKSTNLLNIMMDSPMILDDTIKFQSLLSNIEENDENNSNMYNFHDDEDEETLRKFEAMERENILMNCNEYREDILKYMKKMEVEYKAKANYMKKQQDINSSMRSILVDWLVEVSEEYKLNMETLYLAVNYTDRFLSQMSVLRGKLQLVGTASMYIASKYEEITPPDISEFVYITDDTYTKKQVLRMEHLLLKVLDFRMNAPTVNWFLLYFLRFIKQSTNYSTSSNSQLFQRIEYLSRYLAELTLIDSDTFLSYLPSQIAASAIYLALYTLGKPWTKQIAEITGYNFDLSELKQCIIHLYKAMQQAPDHPQQAIQEKYKQAKYEQVSMIEPPKSLASFIL